MGSQLARGLGVPTRTVNSLAGVMRQELDVHAAELAAAGADPAADGPAVPIFKFDQAKAPAPSDDPISSDSAMAAGGCGRRDIASLPGWLRFASHAGAAVSGSALAVPLGRWAQARAGTTAAAWR